MEYLTIIMQISFRHNKEASDEIDEKITVIKYTLTCNYIMVGIAMLKVLHSRQNVNM